MIDLFVIGAGGTGTYFLKEVSRMIMGNRQIRSLHIFDGDTVEEKNLARQSFIREDIGRNKASVMAEALNDAFGLDWKAHDSYVTEEQQITRYFSSGMWYSPVSRCYEKVWPVLVSCVDNHAARLLLEKIFEESDNCVLFDSGNDFETGEVVFAYKSEGKVAGPVRSVYFPDVKEGDMRSRTEMSCEELNSVAPQHIMVNMKAGQILASGIANFLEERITPCAVLFNALEYTESVMVLHTEKEEKNGER